MYSCTQAQTYVIDKTRSQIIFKIKHMGVLNVNGTFNDFSGGIIIKDRELKSVESRIVVNSIDTDDKTRDASLKNEAYFDTQKYPYLYFHSLEIEINNGEQYIIGLLKIKNIEKEVKIDYNLEEDANNNKLSLKGTTKINRKEFNLDFGTLDALVGNTITITLDIKSFR